MIIFSDLHSHNFTSLCTNRLEIQIGVLRNILDAARSRDCSVLFCGDITHKHGYLPTDVITELVLIFREYSDVNLYAISGNHDQLYKNYLDTNNYTSVQFLSNVLDNFHNIDYNTVVVDGKFSVTGIPYMANTEEFDKLLTVASQGAKASDLPTILMLHQTPTRLYNTFIPSTVDIDDTKLDAFDYVFMGHIHSYQDFGNKRYMVGNPLIQDEQDFGIDKGFLTIEDDGNVGFVKLLTPLDSIADSLRRQKKVVLKETKELAKKEIDHRLFSESIKDQFMAYCDNTKISDELKVIGLNLIK